MEQLRDTDLSEEQRGIADLIIGNIDDYGYLKATVEEMAVSTSLPAEKIAEVLKVIQTFDPPGVGASNLRECLLLQLERAGQQDTLEYRLVRDFMDALGKRRIPEMARGTGRTIEDVQNALGRIARLEPRPGRAFLPDTDQYVLPEVFVQKAGSDFTVTTNDEHIPHLRISNIYKDLMAQVAEAVGVHETTVSRAVSAKYMQTPQGVFEMKFFFTAGLQTASGDGVSNTSVKDMIAEIFRNEDPTKPLSDQEVVKMLGDKGITIARRTVAKYRGELNILPSNLRKVY